LEMAHTVVVFLNPGMFACGGILCRTSDIQETVREIEMIQCHPYYYFMVEM